jgi:2,3-bisphosphoglycerate-dependent phosphoglycerate mutase
VLVVSHGNTVRALVKHLEPIPGRRVAELDIPTGIPLVYELGFDLRLDALGGQYLDPHAASDSIEAIKRQAHQTQPGEPGGRSVLRRIK